MSDNAGNGAARQVIICDQLKKTYGHGSNAIVVLNQLSFSVFEGESVAIMGASGSGKSTLLSLLGALDKPDKGVVEIAGEPVAQLNDTALSQLRNQKLGFVYQFHHLLPEFTALENVAMPLLIRGVKKNSALQQAADWLAKVNLQARQAHRPDALSGGERQRVAIARALVNQPQCVLMDEPTGNLDELSSQSVLALIQELAEKLNTAFVLVTHDKQVASVMDSSYLLHDGYLRRMDLGEH